MSKTVTMYTAAVTLSKHTKNWDEPTQVDHHCILRNLKRVSNESEPENIV